MLNDVSTTARSWTRRNPAVRSVLIPFAWVLSAVLITIAVVVIAGPKPNPIIAFSYLIAILASAWWGGYFAGIIACLLCYLLVPFLLLPDFSNRPFEYARFGLSVVIALLVSRIAAIRREEERKLRIANEELERKIQQRTEELAREKDRYQALANHLMKLQESERLHLSRELHDSLGQELTALRYSLERLGQRLPAEHVTIVQEVVASAGKITGDVRDIAARLRPPILEHLTLPESIEWLLNQWQQRTAIVCTLDIDFEMPELSDNVKLAVFRMCQEALTNIARHAGASRVAVSLHYDAGLQFTVADNGIGFDTALPSRNLGLLGMRERAQGISGTLDIRSSPGNGTSIQLTVPALPISS